MEITMTPIQVKRALEDAGHTQADISRKCKVSKVAVNLVINKKATSQKILNAIAAAIGIKDEDTLIINQDTCAQSVS